MQRLFIYGPPGSGKSTVGLVLAQSLGFDFIDIDDRIQESVGMDIAQIMRKNGESAFRDLESRQILDVCKANLNRSAVVALGGGALLRAENRQACEASGQVIFLSTEIGSILARIHLQDGSRPLLAGDIQGNLISLLEARKEHYASFDFRIDNELGKTPADTVKEIQHQLGIFRLKAMGRPYDVRIQTGALMELPLELKKIGITTQVVVVFDDNTHRIYGSAIEEQMRAATIEPYFVILPPGEENKTLEMINTIWDSCIKAGLDRKSVIVAFGGGVVSDLTGFAASTYMRGCRWVCVPTTLLSMVDASIGGKTGFDLPQGKNLIGSFYPPELVLIDPNVLKSLPEEEFISGMAEVVKHGIISDPALFFECSLGLDNIQQKLEKIVKQAVRVKVEVIEEDPYEKGQRASLNFGHTIGHAIEIESEFKLKHGEAISIGMVAESRLAEKMGLAEPGLTDKIIQVLSKLNLPISIPSDMNKAKIIAFMRNDKKKNGKAVHFALPIRVGEVRTGIAIENLEETL